MLILRIIAPPADLEIEVVTQFFKDWIKTGIAFVIADVIVFNEYTQGLEILGQVVNAVIIVLSGNLKYDREKVGVIMPESTLIQ